MIRWLLYRFVPFYLVLTLLVAAAVLLVSETGLRLLWAQARPYLPEGLTIAQVQGRLIGQITVRDLQYRQGEREIRVAHAWLRWRPLALLRGKIVIGEIVIADSRIHWPAGEAPPPDEDDALPPLPQLPDIELQRLRLRELRYTDGTEGAFHLRAAELSARLQQQALRLDISELRTVGWGDWQLQLDGRLAADALSVESLRIEQRGEPPLILEASGGCAWPALDCTVELTWTRLRWPLAEPRWFSPAGQAELRFEDRQAQATLSAELEGEQLPASQLELSLAPAAAGQHAIQADWRSASGALGLEARYAAATQELSGSLRLQALDLAAWAADYPSQLDGRTDFAWDAEQQLTLSGLALDGTLRGYAFKADGQARYQAGRWAVEGLRMEQGQTRLRADLARDPHWRGSVRLQSPRLAALHPELSGRLELELSLAGREALPAIDWMLQANALAWRDSQLGSVDFRGRWRGEQLEWQLQGRDWALPGQLISRVEQRSEGSPASATHSLTLTGELGETALQARTRWRDKSQQLDLELTAGKLQLEASAWTLQAPARLRYTHAGRKLALPAQCWHSEDTRSCLELDWDGQALQGQWTLADYALARLNHRLPGIAQVEGSSDLRLTIARSAPAQLAFDLLLTTSPVRLTRREDGDVEELLTFQPGRLSASGTLPALQAQWSFPLDAQQGVSGQLQVDAQRQLQGELRLALDNLELLTALVPEILQARGQLDAQLQLSGTQAQPQLAGHLRLREGELHLDKPETVLKNVRADLSGSGESAMRLGLHAESGDGYLDLAGELDWRGSKPALKASIRGKDFLAVATPEARILASPELELSVVGYAVDVSGRLLIPSARIQPRSLNREPQLRAPDPDQVILGQETGIVPRYRISSRVELVLGEGVSFAGFGLNAALAGRLMTRLVPGRPATGTGELSLVNGRYKAYGQDLTIERGRLIFSGGPLTEPGLDVRAYRQATPEIRAGVIVRGPISRPELSLYSDPLMRETDQLSYLVLGRAAEARSDADQATLNNAALALGLKGSDFLASRFKGTLGLDEVRIGTTPGESADQASLVLGKYLSPNIYVSYGVGLFEPVYVFQLRYQLSRRWTLQTESGLESGGDLLYTIER